MNLFKKDKEQKVVENEEKKAFTLNKELSQKFKEVKEGAILKLQNPKVSLAIAGGSIALVAIVAGMALIGDKEEAPKSAEVSTSTSYSQSTIQEESNSLVTDEMSEEEIHYFSNGKIDLRSFPELKNIIVEDSEYSMENSMSKAYTTIRFVLNKSGTIQTLCKNDLLDTKPINAAWILLENKDTGLYDVHFVKMDDYVTDKNAVPDYLQNPISLGSTDLEDDDVLQTVDLSCPNGENMYVISYPAVMVLLAEKVCEPDTSFNGSELNSYGVIYRVDDINNAVQAIITEFELPCQFNSLQNLEDSKKLVLE